MKRDRLQGSNGMRWMAGLGAVGLLSVAAYLRVFPAYQDYRVQGKVAEVFVSVDACRAEVSQAMRVTTAPMLSTSLFVCDGGASSGVKISRYLKSIAVRSAGAITVTLDYRSLSELTQSTNTLTLVPLADASTALGSTDVHKAIVAWRCGDPKDGTTVPNRYLPADCRG